MKSLLQMPVHAPVDPEEAMETIGQRIQSLAAGRSHLPRSTIGKVLKQELRAPYWLN